MFSEMELVEGIATAVKMFEENACEDNNRKARGEVEGDDVLSDKEGNHKKGLY